MGIFVCRHRYHLLIFDCSLRPLCSFPVALCLHLCCLRACGKKEVCHMEPSKLCNSAIPQGAPGGGECVVALGGSTLSTRLVRSGGLRDETLVCFIACAASAVSPPQARRRGSCTSRLAYTPHARAGLGPETERAPRR